MYLCGKRIGDPSKPSGVPADQYLYNSSKDEAFLLSFTRNIWVGVAAGIPEQPRQYLYVPARA